jgi:hypothetical protein
LTAFLAVIPVAMSAVNKVLLPAGGVAGDPLAMLIWFFLSLAVIKATWGFIQSMIGGKKAKA